eukprot:scaffold31315_cov49-Attheya_sp.AAC.1
MSTSVRRGSKSSFKKSASDDLICPISLDLPYEPVTAEDGRVYEKKAIVAHFDRHPKSATVKSPVTNEPMGRRLTASVQTKSLIETLIETGAIKGDLAEAWDAKGQDRRDVDLLIREAEAGDGMACHKVGKLYGNGDKGVTKDLKLAYPWFKRAADLGNVKGLAMAGYCLVMGGGVKRNQEHGLSYISMAAEGGSDYACLNLGMWYTTGTHGLPVETQQAIRLIKKGLSGDCKYRHANESFKDESRSKLQEISPSSVEVPLTIDSEASDSD